MLRSVVGEIDPSGNLTTSAKYDVYGAKRTGGTGTATSRQGFVGSLGHVTDSETGLVYMRARYYDPQTGRFISEDPKCDGVNWFAYADNSPINEVDANGKDPKSEEEAFKQVGELLENSDLWTKFIVDVQVKPLAWAIETAIPAAAGFLRAAGGKFASQLRSLFSSEPVDPESELEVDTVIQDAKAVGDIKQAVGLGAQAVETTDEDNAIT